VSVSAFDVHAHVYPTDLPRFRERTGDLRWPELDRTSRPRIWRNGAVYRVIDDSYFDVDQRLARMERLGIIHQDLSPLPVLLPFWAEPQTAGAWCRSVNDAVARIAATSNRLSAMGILPLQDVAGSLVEIERLVATGFVGVELGTALDNGRVLADPAVDDVLTAIAEAGLRVLVHPTQETPLASGSVAVQRSLGLLTDSAMTMADLLLRGDLAAARYPLMCIAHGGGTLLWSWHQIATRTQSALKLPSWLHVDTVGCSDAQIAFAGQVVGAKRVMFGSDLPATKDNGIPLVLDSLAMKAPDILARNARRFFGMSVDHEEAS
jgi:aminocarboxymuconate-semialdehyde decarboxylase